MEVLQLQLARLTESVKSLVFDMGSLGNFG